MQTAKKRDSKVTLITVCRHWCVHSSYHSFGAGWLWIMWGCSSRFAHVVFQPLLLQKSTATVIFIRKELEEFSLVPSSPCCFVSVPLQRALALCHGVLEMGDWPAMRSDKQIHESCYNIVTSDVEISSLSLSFLTFLPISKLVDVWTLKALETLVTLVFQSFDIQGCQSWRHDWTFIFFLCRNRVLLGKRFSCRSWRARKNIVRTTVLRLTVLEPKTWSERDIDTFRCCCISPKRCIFRVWLPPSDSGKWRFIGILY